MLFERTVLAVFFVGVGAYGFVHSIHTGNGWLAAASAIESGLFYPALNSVQKIRRENQKIRLLELALTNAKTTDKAAAAVEKVFTEEFGDNRGGTNVTGTNKHGA
jgi:hypothetical protein